MKKWVILLCGGIGSRVGYPFPKQFIKVGGKEIILHTLDKFVGVEDIQGITIVCHKDYIVTLSTILKENANNYSSLNISIIESGNTCNDSIRNGIAHLNSIANENDIVIIHDSVRPFIDSTLIDAVASGAEKYGSCCPKLSCYETIFLSSDGLSVTENIDRSKLYRVQTPQAYKFSRIKYCYDKLNDISKSDFVYANELYYFIYNELFLCDGYKYNFKITDREDLNVMNALIFAKNHTD